MDGIVFAPELEPSVRLIEETPPGQVVEVLAEAVVARPDGEHWHRALALAALRSTRNDGLANGYLPHSLIALHDARLLAARLSGLRRLLPFLQVAAYTVGAYRGGMRDPAYGRFRLPAEMVRDNALAIGGLLNVKIGGPSVYPYQPEGIWDGLAGYTYPAADKVPADAQHRLPPGSYRGRRRDDWRRLEGRERLGLRRWPGAAPRQRGRSL